MKIFDLIESLKTVTDLNIEKVNGFFNSADFELELRSLPDRKSFSFYAALIQTLVKAANFTMPEKIQKRLDSWKEPVMAVDLKSLQEDAYKKAMEKIEKILSEEFILQLENQKFSEAEQLFKRGANINYLDKNAKSPLSNALRVPQWPVVQWLVENGANLIQLPKVVPKHLNFPAYHGNFELFELMLQKGVESDVDTLHCAIIAACAPASEVSRREGGFKIAQHLLNNTSLKPLQRFHLQILGFHHDSKPTLVLALENNYALFEALVKSRMDLSDPVLNGDSMLHYAVAKGDQQAVALSLRSCLVDKLGQAQKTPLSLAIANIEKDNFYDIAKQLFNGGADPRLLSPEEQEKLKLKFAQNQDDRDLLADLNKQLLKPKPVPPVTTLAVETLAVKALKPITASTSLLATETLENIQSTLTAQLKLLESGTKQYQAIRQLKKAVEKLPEAIHEDNSLMTELKEIIQTVIKADKDCNRETKLVAIAAFEEKHKPSIGHKIAAIIFGLVGAAIGAAIGFTGGAFLGGAIGPQAMASGLYGLAHGTYTGWAIGTASAMGVLALTGGLTAGMGYYSFFGRSPLQKTITAATKVADTINPMTLPTPTP